MLLDPPKKLPPGWAKNRKKLGQFPSEGGGLPCPNFFLKAEGEKTEKTEKTEKKEKVGPIPKRGGGGFPCPNQKKPKKW